MVADRVQPFDVLETRKGTIRCCTKLNHEISRHGRIFVLTKSVGCHHYSILVLQTKDARPSNDWLAYIPCHGQLRLEFIVIWDTTYCVCSTPVWKASFGPWGR
jgi:hypothetical protein